MLAARFSRNRTDVRSDKPLSDDAIRAAVPSIFAEAPHSSRSGRYTYIPTIEVLNALRREGFQPFAACQTRTRDAEKRDTTKHLLRLRHASQINGKEANEIVLLNSHDGSSSYQLVGGCYRFVCANGMVCGETVDDIRVRHSGNVTHEVIEGACRVLDAFALIDEQREAMQALPINAGEQAAFARAALMTRYDDADGPAPVTESQILMPRRHADQANDLWTTFNRVQENLVRGGLSGRNRKGKPTTTRGVAGIDQNVKLNRALWTLAEEMRRLKG